VGKRVQGTPLLRIVICTPMAILIIQLALYLFDILRTLLSLHLEPSEAHHQHQQDKHVLVSEPCPVRGRTWWPGEGIYRTMPWTTDDDRCHREWTEGRE